MSPNNLSPMVVRLPGDSSHGIVSPKNTSPVGAPMPGGLNCALCGSHVADVSSLQHHVLTRHSFSDLLARAAEGVLCAPCLLPFSNPGALAQHIKLLHSADGISNTAPILFNQDASIVNDMKSSAINDRLSIENLNGSLYPRKRNASPDLPTDLSSKKSKLGTSEYGTFMCSQCNAAFDTFESFRTHLKTHIDGRTNSESYNCSECKISFASEIDLGNHMMTHFLSVSTEFGCQACCKLFSKPDELQKHLLEIHAHHLYKCALCKEVFDSKVAIQVHFAVKHSNECKMHRCSKCSIVFKNFTEFENHVRMIHTKHQPVRNGIRCLLCDVTVSDEEQLSIHVETHEKSFKCSICKEGFHVEFLLDKHHQEFHNTEIDNKNGMLNPETYVKSENGTSGMVEELRCPTCELEFYSRTALLSHMNEKHGKIQYDRTPPAESSHLICPYCKESCATQIEFDLHSKTRCGASGRYKCNICDEMCISARELARHKLSHLKSLSGGRCSQCQLAVTTEQQILRHQSRHYGTSLPQPCVVCRQILLTEAELAVHAQFHGTSATNGNESSPNGETLNSSSSNITETSFPSSSNINDDASSSIVTSSFSSKVELITDTLKCPICHVKLESIEEAELHPCLVAHRNNNETKLQDAANLLNFKQSASSSKNSYQCIKCQENFATEAEVELHVSLTHLHHPNGCGNECHLCGETFESPLRLQCHLIEHTFQGNSIKISK